MVARIKDEVTRRSKRDPFRVGERALRGRSGGRGE